MIVFRNTHVKKFGNMEIVDELNNYLPPQVREIYICLLDPAPI